jgi:hypothetical protein
MTGITDEKHLVEAGLAICAALRTTGRDPAATEASIVEAEEHLNAVRTPNKGKPDPTPKPPKSKE